jgi:hypothetical protein
VKHTRSTLVDDMDGSPASATIRFGLDGRGYEIDLSDGNAARLRGIFAEYIATARERTELRTTRARRAGKSGSGLRRGRPSKRRSRPGGATRSRAVPASETSRPRPSAARGQTAGATGEVGPESVRGACVLLLASALEGLSSRIAARGPHGRTT